MGTEVERSSIRNRTIIAVTGKVVTIFLFVTVSIVILYNDAGNRFRGRRSLIGSAKHQNDFVGEHTRRSLQGVDTGALYPKAGSWDAKKFVFIGGLPSSGALQAERLLSNQNSCAGIVLTGDHYFLGDSCSMNNNNLCGLPDQDGSYITKAFKDVCEKRKGVSKDNNCEQICQACEDRTFLYGELGQKFRLTEDDATQLGEQGVQTFREKLYKDMSRYWGNKTAAPYAIEKDPENAIRGRFLQAVFGSEHAVFIYVMRHPLASRDCRGLDCGSDLERYIKAWLAFHKQMEADLQHLRHYIVVHDEAVSEKNWGQLKGPLSTLLGGAELIYSQKVAPGPIAKVAAKPAPKSVPFAFDSTSVRRHATVPEASIMHHLYHSEDRMNKAADSMDELIGIVTRGNNFTKTRIGVVRTADTGMLKEGDDDATIVQHTVPGPTIALRGEMGTTPSAPIAAMHEREASTRIRAQKKLERSVGRDETVDGFSDGKSRGQYTAVQGRRLQEGKSPPLVFPQAKGKPRPQGMPGKQQRPAGWLKVPVSAEQITILQKYEDELKHFCYSIYFLRVACESKIWSQSVESP
jgi:hypothetical protein